MPNNRKAGFLNVQFNGEVYDAIGSFTYNLGEPKREGLVGPDRVHGYKEMPQVPFIEGEIRDVSNVDVKNSILNAVDATITIKLANGKTVMLRDAWYAGDGDIGTEEANIQIRFEGISAEEILP